MGAPAENEFWRLRKDLSDDGKKLSIAEIVEKAQEFIDFCTQNPMIEIVVQGGQKHELPKMRAMTLQGLWHHLNITNQTWLNWKKDPKYLEVITRIENLFYTQKFQGAAAGFLNSNIIARDLGLADKKELEGKFDINQITGMEIE